MADITMEITGEGYVVVIDKDIFVRMKELLINQLKLAPKGLDSVLSDVDVETLRRSLKPQLPGAPAYNDGTFVWQGPLGLFMTMVIDLDNWWSTNDYKLVDAMLVPGAYLWGTSVDGDPSFVAAGEITAQQAEYYFDAFAKGLLRALSGEEEGY